VLNGSLTPDIPEVGRDRDWVFASAILPLLARWKPGSAGSWFKLKDAALCSVGLPEGF
jgi:hypothetical protein